MSIRYKITGLTSAPLKDNASTFYLIRLNFIYLSTSYTSTCYVCLYRFDQDGTRVSVVQYFNRQYNYSLKYINWPCLQAGSDSRPTYLPMEVAFVFRALMAPMYPLYLVTHIHMLHLMLAYTYFVRIKCTYFVQVCRIVKGQRYSRKLNECQVTRMLRLARETPEERENSILEVNFAYLSPEFFFGIC